MNYSYKSASLTNWHLSYVARTAIIIASFILLQSCLPIKNNESLKLSVDFSIKSVNFIAQSLGAFSCESDMPLPYNELNIPFEAEETNRVEILQPPCFYALEPHVSGIKQEKALLSSLPFNPEEHFSLYTPVYKLTTMAKKVVSDIGIKLPPNEEFKKSFVLKRNTNLSTSKSIKNSKTKSAQFSWPVRGRITSPFGMRTHPITKSRTFHYGIDIKASSGTKIQAPCDGEVVFTGWAGGYGKMARIKTSNGLVLVFAHMTNIACKEGTKIKKGQLVGNVGSTGRSTGPHLHFGIMNKKKDYVNPLAYLSK